MPTWMNDRLVNSIKRWKAQFGNPYTIENALNTVRQYGYNEGTGRDYADVRIMAGKLFDLVNK